MSSDYGGTASFWEDRLTDTSSSSLSTNGQGDGSRDNSKEGERDRIEQTHK